MSETQPAEQARQLSEERLRALLSASPAILYVFDATPPHRVRFLSENVHPLLGYAPTDFVNDPDFWSSRVHPDDLKQWPGVLERRQREGKFAWDYRFRASDGTWRWTHDEGRLVCGADGRPDELTGCWTDITERKQTEEALLRYEHIFQQAAWGMAMAEHETSRIITVNPAFARMHGYTVEELVGMNLIHTIAPESRSSLAEHVRTLETQGHHTYESIHQRKDGSSFPCWIRVTAYKDSSGRIIYRVGNFEDITERKHTEEARMRGESRYRRLYESIRDPVVTVNLDGRIIEFNTAYQQMLGYSEEQLRRLTYSDITPERWHAIESRIVREQIMGYGYSDVYEKEYRRKDGTVFPVELRAFLVRDESGRPAAMWAIVRDITQRKQITEFMRSAREQLELTQWSVGLGMWTWDIVKGQFEWSRGMFELFGLDPDRTEAGLEAWQQAMHPEDRAALFTAMEQAIKKNLLLHHEYRVLLPKGTVRWISLLGRTFYNQNHQPVRMSGICQDITERKRVGGELEASRQALRALATRLQQAREEERRQIARIVHDELGHAFTDLKLDLAWLERRLEELQLRSQSPVRKKIAAMMKQVTDNLETARQLSTDLRPALLDTLGLVAALEWESRLFESRTRVRCELDLPPEPFSLDAGRSTTLFRIFQEALSNVTRHAAASAVQVRMAGEVGRIVLEVADNGRGITPEQAEHPQALGLLGMRERAMEFGGEVTLHGAPGRGTTVRVIIPLHSS